MEQGRKQYPTYRQWKAWKNGLPLPYARLCFICKRPLRSTDGLSTRRIIGGKAAAFGGVGRERLGWNKPEDSISAGCTVKVNKLVRESITPAYTVTFNGVSYTIPEKSEKEYQSTLMRVSASGIACDICCEIALMNLDEVYPNTVDISEIVRECDPDDAPDQVERSPEKVTVKRLLLGIREVCKDNIIRVKQELTPVTTFTIVPDEPSTTPKPKKIKAVVVGISMKKLQDSLTYWTSPRKVSGAQTVEFISNKAYESMRDLSHALRYPLGEMDFTEQPTQMHTPIGRFK